MAGTSSLTQADSVFLVNPPVFALVSEKKPLPHAPNRGNLLLSVSPRGCKQAQGGFCPPVRRPIRGCRAQSIP